MLDQKDDSPAEEDAREQPAFEDDPFRLLEDRTGRSALDDLLRPVRPILHRLDELHDGGAEVRSSARPAHELLPSRLEHVLGPPARCERREAPKVVRAWRRTRIELFLREVLLERAEVLDGRSVAVGRRSGDRKDGLERRSRGEELGQTQVRRERHAAQRR